MKAQCRVRSALKISSSLLAASKAKVLIPRQTSLTSMLGACVGILAIMEASFKSQMLWNFSRLNL